MLPTGIFGYPEQMEEALERVLSVRNSKVVFFNNKLDYQNGDGKMNPFNEAVDVDESFLFMGCEVSLWRHL